MALARDLASPFTRFSQPYGRPEFPKSFVGFLGEVVLEKVLRQLEIPCARAAKTTHDYVIFGRTWEAKTQYCSVPPRKHHEANVSDLTYDHQRVFGYIFMRAQATNKFDIQSYFLVYVCGVFTREQLLQYGVHHEAGETANKLTFPQSCQSLKLFHLTPVSKIEEVIKCNRSSL